MGTEEHTGDSSPNHQFSNGASYVSTSCEDTDPFPGSKFSHTGIWAKQNHGFICHAVFHVDPKTLHVPRYTTATKLLAAETGGNNAATD